MLLDTHVHFDGIGDLRAAGEAIGRAAAAGVSRLLAVGGSPRANEFALTVAQHHPGIVFPAVGFDREQATLAVPIEPLERTAATHPVVAIGEIGLDYHYLPDSAQAQEQLMERMLALARRRSLPVIVHSREAESATLRLLREHAAQWPDARARLGVLHCFTGSQRFAAELVELGFHISFSGIVTFRNAEDLRAVAAHVPDDRLLIETDTPYLAPEPHRGRPNKPALLPFVAEALARARGTTPDAIAELTTRNAQRLFGRLEAS